MVLTVSLHMRPLGLSHLLLDCVLLLVYSLELGLVKLGPGLVYLEPSTAHGAD